VLKFSVLLYVTIYLVVLVAGAMLWAVASATGVRQSVEKFIGQLIASGSFSLLGGTVAKASILGGAVLVAIGTGVNVLMSVLYNLISDVVGGVVVIFEERPGRGHAVQLDEADEPLPPLRPTRPAQARRGQLRAPRPPREQPTGARALAPTQPVHVDPVDLTRPAD